MAVTAESLKAGEPSSTEAVRAISATSAVPLVIGVTGHRDLVPEEVPRIRDMVRGFLRTMQASFPDLPLVVMSALAEGADRLVAAEARAMGLPLIVPLPMPRELYVTDFETRESREEFEDLSRGAEVLELPILDGSMPEAVGRAGPHAITSTRSSGSSCAPTAIFCWHCGMASPRSSWAARRAS